MMTPSRPHRTACHAIIMSLGAAMACSCGEHQPARIGGLDNTHRNSLREREGASSDLMGSPPGVDDWGEDRGRLGPSPGGASRHVRPGTGTAGSASRPTVWTIVLATFSVGDHRQAAANALLQLPAIAPGLADARVHGTSNGSMVVFGSYDSAQDPDAQRDLKRIKQITLSGRPVFPRAMLTRIQPRPAPGTLHPHDLLSVRLRYPKVDPLYTLEVAVWGDFESGQLTLDEIHRRAEAHAQQLRTQGFEAYFYHDDDKRLSMVTVGVFDHRAIDPRSGLFSAAVEALMKRFPAHLVNGEPLQEPIYPRFPDRGTRIQKPRLVLVPKL